MKHTALAVAFLIAGCQPTPKRVNLTAIPPAPAAGPLEVHAAGPAVILSATAEDEKGKAIRGIKIAFASSDPKVATVDAKGVVQALKSGAARITATAAKAHAELELAISIPARLELCPVGGLAAGHCPALAAGSPLVLHAGHRGAVAVRLFDDAGRAIDPDQDREHPMATVSSENTNVVTVGPGGLLSALAPGQTNVTVRVGLLRTSLPVKVAGPDFDRLEVTPKKLALKVTRTGRLAAAARLKKAPVSDVAIAWTTSNPAVAMVSADGTVKAVGKGQATILASAGGLTCKTVVAVK